MAGTISFGGIGSGIDTEGIVQGLVQASRGNLSAMKSRAASTTAAVSTLSELGSLLAKLKSSLSALSDPTGVASYSASSSSSAIAVSANGSAAPGAYSIEVSSLAKEQRSYTNTFASATTALGQTGSLAIQVGGGSSVNVTVEAGDTLESLVTKINSSGARVGASIFYDGQSYRMQVRGLDTGAANAVSFTETGVSLGLSQPANTVQAASDATLKIDGFTVTRPTNQIAGAIQGVTLALTETTTSPVTVKIESDPGALEQKMRDVVSAYNAVVDKVQQTAGYGSVKATNPVLAGDSTLRGLSTRLSAALGSVVSGAGTYQTLAAIGLSIDKNGKLSLDELKLDKAIDADPTSVEKVLAGATGADGAMDVLGAVVESFTATGTGLLDMKTQTLQEREKAMNERVDREEDRLERYADQLRKQFQAMDTSVAAYNAQLDYLFKAFSG